MDNKLLEKYEQSTIFRALVNLIPKVGDSLDILLSSKGSKWREERLKKEKIEYDKRMKQLDKDLFL